MSEPNPEYILNTALATTVKLAIENPSTSSQTLLFHEAIIDAECEIGIAPSYTGGSAATINKLDSNYPASVATAKTGITATEVVYWLLGAPDGIEKINLRGLVVRPGEVLVFDNIAGATEDVVITWREE